MHTGTWFLIVRRNVDAQDMYVELLRHQRLPVVGVNTCEDAVKATHLVAFGATLFDVDCRDDWARSARLRNDLGCAGFVAKPAAAGLVIRALQRAAAGSPWTEYVE